MQKNEQKKNEKTNEKSKIVFHKDMTLVEVLELHPYTRNVLMGFGMHCIGCPISQMETLEEASQVHGIELDFLLSKLDEVNELDISDLNISTTNFFEDDF